MLMAARVDFYLMKLSFKEPQIFDRDNLEEFIANMRDFMSTMQMTVALKVKLIVEPFRKSSLKYSKI